MPYDGEFAKYESVRRLVTNPRIQDFLKNCETQDPIRDANAFVQPVSLERSSWLPDYVIAIDGSHQEAFVRNGFPGAEISYLTVACVILDLKRMRELDERRPVNPKAFNELKKAEAIDAIFPGCNVALKGGLTPKATLRQQFYKTLEDHRQFSGCESILETYEVLLRIAGHGKRFECPYDTCDQPDRQAPRGPLQYACDCSRNASLFSSDALRFHDGMAESGPNGAMFAEISQVLEHLWLINLLRSIEAKGWTSSLKRIAIFMDGPLAVFGHPAWLSQAIKLELRRLNDVARELNGNDLMIVGIEKSGAFETHLQMLDIKASGEPNRYPPQTLFLVDDDYIKKRIQLSVSLAEDTSANPKTYGKDTYYGRKILYKTRTGALIVGVLPFLHDGDDDLKRAEPDQYPRLADALNLLDELVSARYPNSLVPIIEAHAEAAIPMNMGQRVLEKLTSQLLT